MRPAVNFPLSSSRQHGLTLIELIVAIAVLAIIATVGIPNFQQFTARNEVAAEVLRLTTALNLARNVAITRRTTITVCPSTDQLTCNNSDWSLPLVIIEGRADGGTVDGDVLRIMQESRVPQVTYRKDNRPIRYGQLGRPAGHNGTFSICGHYKTGVEVIVSNFGRIRSVPNTPENC
ncbi:GspH/FimT family pseudopilin [Halomonas sp. 25-S5]|uniref:GspH/FimT family pseudopilin n=1 Tax=Halomonas sp. 25-S5 TaxID=2994065 RepID=UPI0024682416|nr:GspH/FimT family pseudopilin [Halomonas sp. 25-S5]